MGAFTKTETLWFNGKLVPWDQAQVHVLAHGLHYGTGVFEGIRSYQTPDGPAVFRLEDHFRRFFQSAALYELEIPYRIDQLMEATLEVVRQNRLGNAYLRPIAFFDAASLDLWTKGCPVSVAIAGMPRGDYLTGGIEQGVRVTISPVRRFDASAIPTTAKSCGQYVNSVRAVQDAVRRGFDEAIMLNQRGEVAEGSGENLFVVKAGALMTNDAEADILMGITRQSILEIAKDLNLPVTIKPLTMADLASADELFFCGTAVEVTPICSVDDKPVGGGRPGPISRRVQKVFFEAVRGQRQEYRKWLAYASKEVTIGKEN